MKKKLFATLGIFLVFLLVISNTSSQAIDVQKTKSECQTVVVHVAQHNLKQNLLTKNAMVELSLEEAEELKERFLSLETSFSGSEKIKEQLKILQEINIISSNLTFDLLLSILEKVNDSYHPFLFNNMKTSRIFSGPMIVTHLTIGDRIHGILPIKKPRFYYHFINKSNIDGYAGLLPLYLGFSFKPVYVTAVGYKVPKLNNHLFFIFFELLIPCIGTSIAFVVDSENSSPTVLFEYNLDICLLGTFNGFIF